MAYALSAVSLLTMLIRYCFTGSGHHPIAEDVKNISDNAIVR